MGVFHTIEKKLEGAVQGIFARAFKGDVQPIEITAKIQKDMDAKAALISENRKLVPNKFIISLSPYDYERLSPYSQTLTSEMKTLLTRYAAENNYAFSGGLLIRFQLNEDLPTGKFKLSSAAEAGVAVDSIKSASVSNTPKPNASMMPPATPNNPATAPQTATNSDSPDIFRENNLVSPNSSPEPPTTEPNFAPVELPEVAKPQSWPVAPSSPVSSSSLWEEEIPAEIVTTKTGNYYLEVNGISYTLTVPGCVLGRGSDADIRINDPSMSRKHAQIIYSISGDLSITDLGSTNGIKVNGVKVNNAELTEGSVIEMGSTRILVARHD